MIDVVYFDMDGVLADFVKFVEDHSEITIEQMNSLPGDAVGEFIVEHLEGKDLFYSLDPMEDYAMMLSMAEFIQNEAEICVEILTCVGKHKPRIASNQKKEWLERHRFPVDLDYSYHHTFSSKDKSLFACPRSLLIDDRTKSCKPFEEAGGKVIHHKDAISTYIQLREMGIIHEPIPFIESQIESHRRK